MSIKPKLKNSVENKDSISYSIIHSIFGKGLEWHEEQNILELIKRNSKKFKKQTFMKTIHERLFENKCNGLETTFSERNIIGWMESLYPFKTITEIGSGAYGKVFSISNEKAVKVILPYSDSDETEKMQECFEILMGLYLGSNECSKCSSHSVKIIQVCMYDDVLLLEYPFCPNSDLKQYLTNNMNLSTKKRLEIIKNCALAVQNIHVNHCIHLDIKPENMLMCEQCMNNLCFGIKPKMIDFGMSCFDMYPKLEYWVGTPGYVSSFMIRDYNKWHVSGRFKAKKEYDVWSFMVMFVYVLLFDEEKTHKKILDKLSLMNSDYESYDNFTSSKHRSLIEKMKPIFVAGFSKSELDLTEYFLNYFKGNTKLTMNDIISKIESI